MKRNDSGDFCVLYIEPNDETTGLINVIIGQKKPVVIMLAEQTRAFRHAGGDFTVLKQAQRQLAAPIVFVIPQSDHLTHMAAQHGFPVYVSMDALGNALATGHQGVGTSFSASPAELDAQGRAKANPYDAGHQAVGTSFSASATELDAMGRAKASPYDAGHQQPTLLPPVVPVRPRQPRRLSIALIVLMLLAVCAASVGYLLMSLHNGPASTPAIAPPVIGHVYFLSSEQLSENSNQGINDEIQINLTHIASPAAQKSYYAWLLGDKSQAETRSIALGPLPVHGGAAHLFYTGDKQHTNLLEVVSRCLVTEEDAVITPITPSLDVRNWRYYAEFSQTTPSGTMNNANTANSSGMNGGIMNMTNYSFLDHLRHLLASDPMLNDVELPGGLNTWLYRNMGKVLEWTNSTRENWEEGRDVRFIRRQVIRTLAYLDGMSFVQMDLPTNTPLNVNERLARVGLIEMDGPNQNPSSYLDSIVYHLNGVLHTIHNSPSLSKDASAIIDALSNVRSWLNKVHQDAMQLAKMSDAQLNQPGTFTLLNDMIDNANHAYVGQTDAATGEMHGGVIWIHDHVQALAMLDVTPYQPQGAHT